MIKKLGIAIANHIRENPNSHFGGRMAYAADKIIRAYWNERNWDTDVNGEEFVLQTFIDNHSDGSALFFDVGANLGEWTQLVLDKMSDCSVYAFEIEPENFAQLQKEFAGDERVKPYNVGLSDRTETISVPLSTTSQTHAITPRETSPWHDEAKGTFEANLDRGDAFLKKNDNVRVDYLKVDVEGHEVSVIKGFSDILSDPEKRPRLIQFEYGDTFIPPRVLLKDVYDILVPCGYEIGRLYKSFVDFQPYRHSHETFRMGNYIAVQSDDPLRSVLGQDCQMPRKVKEY